MQIIFIGVASAVAVTLMVTLMLVTVVLLFNKCTNKHYGLNEQNEPVYEEINGPINSTNPAAINMEINCSYGDIQTIRMTESPAYGYTSQPASK